MNGLFKIRGESSDHGRVDHARIYEAIIFFSTLTFFPDGVVSSLCDCIR